MSINSCTLDGIKGITQLNGISCVVGGWLVGVARGFYYPPECPLSPRSYIGIYVAFIYLFAGRINIALACGNGRW